MRGTFPTLDRVPTSALTLTIPALTSAAHMACVVPGPTKPATVRRLLRGAVEPACPASALRLHPGRSPLHGQGGVSRRRTGEVRP